MDEVLLLAEHALDGRRLQRFLPKVRALSGLEAVAALRPWEVGVLVLAVRSCASRFGRDALKSLHRRGLDQVTVLVTPFERDNVRVLVRRWRGAVAWLESVPDELPQAVRKLRQRSLSCRVHDLLLAHIHRREDEAPVGRSESMGSALGLAFLAPGPPQSHAAIAQAVGVPEGQFRDNWRALGFPGRSEALLDWSYLARGLEMCALGYSISRAAYSLGIEPWRLQRAAYRRTGGAVGTLNGGSLIRAATAWLAQAAG